HKPAAERTECVGFYPFESERILPQSEATDPSCRAFPAQFLPLPECTSKLLVSVLRSIGLCGSSGYDWLPGVCPEPKDSCRNPILVCTRMGRIRFGSSASPPT